MNSPFKALARRFAILPRPRGVLFLGQLAGQLAVHRAGDAHGYELARRAERIVDIQSEIIDAWNDERQGDVMEVLCEGFDGQSMLFVGRSYAESPDIDGRIYFSAPRDVAAGEFVPVRITGAMDGELTGELAEE